MPRSRWIVSFAVAVPLLLVVVVDPVSEDLSCARFDVGKAMDRVGLLAGAPHPTGSAHNGVVRAYLMDELRSMRLNPEVQRATVEGRSIQNVVARIPGTDGEDGILLCAHYDTVPESLGRPTIRQELRSHSAWQSSSPTTPAGASSRGRLTTS